MTPKERNRAARDFAERSPQIAAAAALDPAQWDKWRRIRHPKVDFLLRFLEDQARFISTPNMPLLDDVPPTEDERRQMVQKAIVTVLRNTPVGDGLSALADCLPVPIDTRNDRPDPLFPAPLVHVKRDDRRAGNLFSPAMWADTRKGQIDLFPGFGPGQADGPLVPALPLALYDLGKGAKMTRGPGAPLALRIFVEAVLSVPAIERDCAVLLPPQRFGDFLAALYPDHAPNYRKKDYPRFLEAIAALDAARIPWENEDGTGALRRVVYARDLPREGSRDDWIQFAVDIPPGGERGALVDRAALRLTGVVSAPAYRLTLSLAFWWNDPGRMRTPTNKGGGRGKLWRQTRKPERYPEVTDAELIAMAYPSDAGDVGTGRRVRLHRAKGALAYLVSIGYAEVHPRKRIMPGPDWAGWDAIE